MTTNYMKFNSVDELSATAQYLDKAEETPLFYRDSDGIMQEVENSKGILNTTQGYYIGTVSDGYSILQNSDMVLQLSQAFETLDITPVGQICNDYHRVSLELHFPQFAMDDMDNNKPVYMGTRILNPYNKSTGFRGHGFLHRVWCANGAYAQYSMPALSFSEVHRGSLENRSVEILSGYVNKLEGASKVIGGILKTASEYNVYFDAPDHILVSLVEWAGAQRAGKEIYDCLLKEVKADELEVSRYDLWNAFTRFASHKEGLSLNVKDRLNKVAETLLYPQVEFAPANDWESKLKVPKPPKSSKKAKPVDDIEDAEWRELAPMMVL